MVASHSFYKAIQVAVIALMLTLTANSAMAEAKWVVCKPVGVMTYNNSPRIHVRCRENFNGIFYFALSTAEPLKAARTLSILITALAADRRIEILYDTIDLSGAGIGCQTNDCRLILAAGFTE